MWSCTGRSQAGRRIESHLASYLPPSSSRRSLGALPKLDVDPVCSHVSNRVTNGHVSDGEIRQRLTHNVTIRLPPLGIFSVSNPSLSLCLPLVTRGVSAATPTASRSAVKGFPKDAFPSLTLDRLELLPLSRTCKCLLWCFRSSSFPRSGRFSISDLPKQRYR